MSQPDGASIDAPSQKQESGMDLQGWDRLLADVPRYGPKNPYHIPAYSEMMPAPLIGWRPYGSGHPAPRRPDDPHAWLVSEREQVFEVEPGLQHIAARVLAALQRLDREQPSRGLNRENLRGNAYWPPELAALRHPLPHERFVTLMSLAVSKTQDDKGLVRWTFFGGSDRGPDRAFWRGFYDAPGRERRPEYAADFLRRLLHAAYQEPMDRLGDLRGAGFRILPGSGEAVCDGWRQDPLPGWTAPFILREGEPLKGIRYLLTFRPFGSLPRAVRRAYLEGRLHLLPFPGSLVFWGEPSYLTLQAGFRHAMQIPLLNVCDRREQRRGLRILQSGWLHEPRAGETKPDSRRKDLRSTYRRTHRWERVERHADALAVPGEDDRLAHVLFSADPESVGLYGKPMARNAQIWTERYEMLLDGPRAGRDELLRTARALRAGGRFGYRFIYPPMQVGKHEVFWHLPMVAFLNPRTRRPQVLDDAPLGYFTAEDIRSARPGPPVELWPELRRRPEFVAAARGYQKAYGHRDHQSALNAHKLLEVWDFLGRRPLPWDAARHIAVLPKEQGLEEWLRRLDE